MKKFLILLIVCIMLACSLNTYAIESYEAQKYIGQRVQIHVYLGILGSGPVVGTITNIGRKDNGKEYLILWVKNEGIYTIYLDTISWIKPY